MPIGNYKSVTVILSEQLERSLRTNIILRNALNGKSRGCRHRCNIMTPWQLFTPSFRIEHFDSEKSAEHQERPVERQRQAEKRDD